MHGNVCVMNGGGSCCTCNRDLQPFDTIQVIHGTVLIRMFRVRLTGTVLPVLSAHSLHINHVNGQLLFMNQWKRKNGRRNVS